MLAKVLKEKRLQAGLSRGDVAKALGWASPQLCSNFERSLSFPPARSVKKLAKIYGQDQAKFVEEYVSALAEDYKQRLLKRINGVK